MPNQCEGNIVMTRFISNFTCAVFSVLLVVSSNSAFAASQIQGPVSYEGHNYILLSADTWTASEAAAVTLGGHLVTINSAAENDFVFNTFTTNGTLNRNLWIGLNDLAVEGAYVWASGESLTFTNWLSGEPNNLFDFEGGNPGRDEDVVQILSHPLFPDLPMAKWNDFADNGNFRGILSYGVVEVTVTPIPEPEIYAMMSLGLGLLGWVGRRNKLQAA